MVAPLRGAGMSPVIALCWHCSVEVISAPPPHSAVRLQISSFQGQGPEGRMKIHRRHRDLRCSCFEMHVCVTPLMLATCVFRRVTRSDHNFNAGTRRSRDALTDLSTMQICGERRPVSGGYTVVAQACTCSPAGFSAV